jgi:acetyl esterase/lipase
VSEARVRHDITRISVVYRPPEADAIVVRHDVALHGADGRAMLADIYYPPEAGQDTPAPVAVIVAGFPDPGFERIAGCRFKEMESVRSWGRLIAASGIAAIAYSPREPAADLGALLRGIPAHDETRAFDVARLGLWASSGNVPVALHALMRDAEVAVACGVLCYGYTIDIGAATDVAEAQAVFKFANPAAGRSVDHLAAVPLFVARAGADAMPGLNGALDRFVSAAVARNLPVTFVNHPGGPHAFDLVDDSDVSRRIVRQILWFMRAHLVEDD